MLLGGAGASAYPVTATLALTVGSFGTVSVTGGLNAFIDATSTLRGLGFCPLTLTGSTTSATCGGPLFTLVTPTFVTAFSDLALLPVFGTFALRGPEVPEPGGLLLVASGALGLALAVRRR